MAVSLPPARPFCHAPELNTLLPPPRGAVETKVGHLAARTHPFAANLDVKRQSRTVTLQQRQQRVFSPPTRWYTAGNVGSRTGPKLSSSVSFSSKPSVCC